MTKKRENTTKKIMQGLVDIGADASTRHTLKAGLKVLGIKPKNPDKHKQLNLPERDVLKQMLI